MDVNLFIDITSRAWALPILSHFNAGVAGRQATLLTATGASRTAFTQSMDHLIEIGLLERNPGHGHPLRPEFRLTQLGKPAAEIAHKIQTITIGEDQAILRRTWTVPILASLNRARHFSEIRGTLPTITDRALSQSLVSMEDRNWVRRSVSETVRPPRPIYSAINTGLMISRVTGPEITWANSEV